MPNITTDELSKQVRARRLAPLYLFHGEDSRRIEQLVDEVESTIDPADRPFAVDRLYAGEASGAPVEIAASARGLPMLGDRRLVIVLRAERLLKPKRASKAAAQDDDAADEGGEEAAVDYDALDAYLASPSSAATIVFAAADIDKSRRFTKQLLQKASVIECGGVGGDTAAERREGQIAAESWIREELTRSGRTIDPDAVRLLVSRSGLDISQIRGDVERLLLYTEGRARITLDDVDEVALSGAIVDDWAVVNAIGDGDAGRALRELALRVDRGDSPHGIVGQLRWWVSTRLAPEADAARVRAALDALLRTDLALKSSGGDERALVEKLVIELTGKPLPKRGWK